MCLPWVYLELAKLLVGGETRGVDRWVERDRVSETG